MGRKSRNPELWIAFILILLITFGYLLVVAYTGSIPAASDFFGHSLGVVGFVLMLMTETLYSLRKRSLSARWGRMSWWLRFHIVTGLVGPYLVLLHTAWKFQGLAGIVMLMVGIVVLSGFVGRYIYTAIPRTADGFEIEEAALERQIRRAEAELQRWLHAQDEATRRLAQRLAELDARLADPATPRAWLWTRWWWEWRYRWAWWKENLRLGRAARQQARRIEALLAEKRRLQRQRQAAAVARRALGLWHAFHVPLGMAMFTLACIHITAALYYATLLR
ncbi:MAG: hypothetical protein GXO37_00610 [Chloroflexi bacterium]|nr:hypothetical protein [Chloroflexota bacterium]